MTTTQKTHTPSGYSDDGASLFVSVAQLRALLEAASNRLPLVMVSGTYSLVEEHGGCSHIAQGEVTLTTAVGHYRISRWAEIRGRQDWGETVISETEDCGSDWSVSDEWGNDVRLLDAAGKEAYPDDFGKEQCSALGLNELREQSYSQIWCMRHVTLIRRRAPAAAFAPLVLLAHRR